MSFLDKILGNIVSPTLGLSFLKNRIEDKLGFKIGSYEMHYVAIKKELFFIIPVDGEKRKYPMEGAEDLIEKITPYLVKEIKDDDVIDYLIVKHSDTIEYDLWYRDKDRKSNILKGTL